MKRHLGQPCRCPVPFAAKTLSFRYQKYRWRIDGSIVLARSFKNWSCSLKLSTSLAPIDEIRKQKAIWNQPSEAISNLVQLVANSRERCILIEYDPIGYRLSTGPSNTDQSLDR